MPQTDWKGEETAMSEADEKKQRLRRTYLEIRKATAEKEKKSAVITEKLIQTPAYRDARVVALYQSMRTEVDTAAIIGHALAAGKTVALPRVTQEGLKFYRIAQGEALIRSPFGVDEPAGDPAKLVDKGKIDLVVVPGVCFDGERNRMGYGKGYYDRFLQGTALRTVALCFQEQIAEAGALPVDKHDVKMDLVITDRNEY